MSQPRYLVAWGGDKRSADALKLGEVLARTFGARLDIVYVVQTESQLFAQHAGERGFESLVAQRARRWVREAAASVGKDITVEPHVIRASSIAAGILDAAQRVNATVIVIGAGSGGRRPVMNNPIVSGLLHASTVPVAMAPRGYRKESFDKLTEITSAIGARPGAQLVVDEAVEASLRAGVPLRLLSLVELSDDKKLPEDARRQAQLALENARDMVAGRCEVTMSVAEGRTLRHAVKHAAWDPRSIVAIGSSRLANHRTTFLGTAAMRMLSELPVPMMVVPRPEH